MIAGKGFKSHGYLSYQQGYFFILFVKCGLLQFIDKIMASIEKNTINGLASNIGFSAV
jgi:hypothetical protein